MPRPRAALPVISRTQIRPILGINIDSNGTIDDMSIDLHDQDIRIVKTSIA